MQTALGDDLSPVGTQGPQGHPVGLGDLTQSGQQLTDGDNCRDDRNECDQPQGAGLGVDCSADRSVHHGPRLKIEHSALRRRIELGTQVISARIRIDT